MDNILELIDIASISNAIMLGLLFISIKSNNRKANIFLSLFLFSLGFEVLSAFLGDSTESVFIPQTTLFTIVFLLFYVQKTINNKINSLQILLFIPGIIINVLLLIYRNYDFSILIFLEYIFNISILIFTLKILKLHKINSSNYYSDLENKTLSWIKTIIFIFLGFHALWIVEDFVGIQNEMLAQPFAIASDLLTFFMIYWFAYNGFSQNEIFKNQLFIYTEEKKEESNISVKVNEKDIEEFELLKTKIEEDKLFSDPKLNLRSLSVLVKIKEKELSRLINSQSKNNFYHFINTFRINEYKILLDSPKAEKLSILGLAQEAGFSSKSTFYTAFKSIVGTTPNEYKMKLKKSE